LVRHGSRRNGKPISTAFVESAVNEIIAKRMNKKQQMHGNRASAALPRRVKSGAERYAETAFRRHYPGFRPASDDDVVSLAA
jgi:hypothetical protein